MQRLVRRLDVFFGTSEGSLYKDPGSGMKRGVDWAMVLQTGSSYLPSSHPWSPWTCEDF